MIRYFVFHVGIGFDAALVAQVERRAALKRYAGHALFAYAGLDTWARHYDRSKPHFSVHHADGSVVDDGYMTVVLNTNPYTYVGNRPFQLAPDATLDRPLTAVTVRSMRTLPFLSIMASALGSGARLRSSKLIDYRPDVSALTVKGYGPFPYQVDGDYLGEIEKLEFRHEPDALRLVMPA